MKPTHTTILIAALLSSSIPIASAAAASTEELRGLVTADDDVGVEDYRYRSSGAPTPRANLGGLLPRLWLPRSRVQPRPARERVPRRCSAVTRRESSERWVLRRPAPQTSCARAGRARPTQLNLNQRSPAKWRFLSRTEATPAPAGLPSPTNWSHEQPESRRSSVCVGVGVGEAGRNPRRLHGGDE